MAVPSRANAYVNRTLHTSNPVPYEIWDWSKSDLSKLSIKDSWIQEPHEKAEETNPDTLVLIVAGNDLNYGLSRVWQAWAGDEYDDSYIFNTLDEADAWLTQRLQAAQH